MQKRWDNPAEHKMPAAARVPASYVVGNVTVAPATVLAPMAGVTDTVFRRFIKNASVFTTKEGAKTWTGDGQKGGYRGPEDGSYVSDALRDVNPELAAGVEAATSNERSGCGLIMTEFTSADGLSRMRETKRKRYLTYYDDEHPIAAQLFGSNPETLADSARIVEEAGFDMVDLNLGCPAKRVVACNGGSGLLRDLPLIETIFKSIRSAVSIPFTVKFRMGWDDSNIVCVQLAKLAEDCGLQSVALHARTRKDGYSGQARWEYIAAVKDAVRIPVIGNGDVRTPEDAAALVEATNCDAVMIGRAAPANPWIFRQIAQYTETGSYDQPTELDRYRMIKTYFEMLLAETQQEVPEMGLPPVTDEAKKAKREYDSARSAGVGKMKQFASWFTHGVAGGAPLRKAIYEAKTGVAVLDSVEKFFEMRLSGAPVDVEAEAAAAREEALASTAAYGGQAAYCD